MWDLRSMTVEELRSCLQELGQPAFRAGQLYDWLQARGAESFDEMTNLPKTLREQLKQQSELRCAAVAQRYDSQLDDTSKYLFRLNDGEYIESVLMHYHHGYTICVSTQVGCKMGCTFCATGQGGFCRNLLPSEIIAQIQAAQRDKNIRISNIVLMGMGEPLDNYDHVMRFLRLVSSEKGLNIGMRHISLSTCGLVDRIYDLMNENMQLTLSVSLHAPNDRIRTQTMLVARRWKIDELLTACRKYGEKTGRRISFEYAMIQGVNDSDACARELGHRLKGILAHVNLIPVNEVTDTGYKRSSRERLERFVAILAEYHITATVRRTLGADINASCGQLRRKKMDEVVQE
jgi:23S rRNA (adenine2503-C2)-methyltransferase